MFAKFKMRLNKDDISDNYRGCGLAQRQEATAEIKRTLDKYILENGNLDADAIEKDWFPKINTHVFLSHSHKDQDLVINLAGYLYHNYNITSFIDSTVWRLADDLLEQINKKYCMYKDGNGRRMYDHSKVIRCAAQVYLLLQGALAAMINQCECLIFVNTPNSLNISDVEGNEKTSSSWIYSELMMADTFPQRELKYHRQGVLSHSYALGELEYRAKLDSFTELTLNDLRMARNGTTIEGIAEDVLNQLYLLKGIM